MHRFLQRDHHRTPIQAGTAALTVDDRIDRELYSSEVQQPARATANLNGHRRTDYAAPMPPEQNRAGSLQPEGQKFQWPDFGLTRALNSDKRCKVLTNVYAGKSACALVHAGGEDFYGSDGCR
jgi:hypothetical protein